MYNMDTIREYERSLGLQIMRAVKGEISPINLYDFGEELRNEIVNSRNEREYEELSNSLLMDALDEVHLLHDDFYRVSFQRNPADFINYAQQLLGEEKVEPVRVIYGTQKS